MNMVSTIGTRRCDALVEALKAEFGGILTERILEAEGVDFLWDARVTERYLGQQIGCDLDDEEASQEFSRIAFLSVLDGRWYAGMCLVNGEGAAVEMLWKRQFHGRAEAEFEFMQAH